MKAYLKNYLQQQLFTKSLDKASQTQGLSQLRAKLKEIVPDISQQYSSFRVSDIYLETKVRNMHAFQMSLIDKVINEFNELVVVDIGDSCGTHLQYLKALYSKDRKINSLSVNLDSRAVERIKAKGLQAIQARVEDLSRYDVKVDVFLCFEVLEHLTDPCRFLHQISQKTDAKYLIVTVPYLKRSRIGLHHIRRDLKNSVNAETTHIFELSPADWKLLFKFSGWKVAEEKIYFQYPRKHWLGLTNLYWKRFDFEGFYGAILTKDDLSRSLYVDW